MTRLQCHVAAVFVLVAVAPVVAHHSVLGFDSTRLVTLQGRVAEVVWRYPHVYIALDAEGAGRRTGRWLIETEAPSVLERLGWERDAVRAGDRISSAGAPSRGGALRLRCDSVETETGRRLPCYPAGPPVLLK